MSIYINLRAPPSSSQPVQETLRFITMNADSRQKRSMRNTIRQGNVMAMKRDRLQENLKRAPLFRNTNAACIV
jgi:hypothetical protein